MRTVDLFAGCGGLSKGFENAGFNIVGAFEYWDTAADCYERNFDHPVYRIDLSNTEEAVNIISGLNPELIIGGPPCQDFSHAGKRVESSRADLTMSYANIINTIRPHYFVMENVDRIQKSNAYKIAREIFTKANYGLSEIVLDASHCGVPQKRKRFFCIGILNQTDNCVTEYITRNLSEKKMTLRDYFGDTLGFEYYYRHPRNYSRRAVFSIDEPAPTMRGVNRPVPQGYPGHPNDACPVEDNVRSLTTLERALIQTFPADFKWIGNKTDTEQMIGNAVPVQLAEFLARALSEYLCDSKQLTINKVSFTTWLTEEKKYSLRSAKDVLSRIKRADSICKITNIPDAKYLFDLEQSDCFDDLSIAVKSQIKRAANLYNEFLQIS